jgi:hypothetical protein
MPLTFAAPYPLRVESVRVGELRLGTIVKEGTPPPDLVITELTVKARATNASGRSTRAAP